MSKFLSASQLLASQPKTPKAPAAVNPLLANYSFSRPVYNLSIPSSSFLPSQPPRAALQEPSDEELDAKADGMSHPEGSPTPPEPDPDVTSDIIDLLETGGATPLGTMPWSQNGGQSDSSGPKGISWAKVGIGVGMVLGGVVLWRLVAK